MYLNRAIYVYIYTKDCWIYWKLKNTYIYRNMFLYKYICVFEYLNIYIYIFFEKQTYLHVYT